jgi:hypothetical protein
MAKNCWAQSCVLKSLKVAQAAEVVGDPEAVAVALMIEVDPADSDVTGPAAASDRLENVREVSAAVGVGVAASDRPAIEAITQAQVEEASTEAPVAISPQEAALAIGQAAQEEDAHMTDHGHHKADDSKHKSFFSVFI